MMRIHRRARRVAVLLALGGSLPLVHAVAGSAAAQEVLAAVGEAGGRRALPIAEYAHWRTIRAPIISADGEWVAWTYAQVRRDDVLHLRHVDTGREHIVERASAAIFSDDGRWAAYVLSPPLREAERLRETSRPVPRGVELMELSTGRTFGWEGVGRFEFGRGSSHLAILKARPDAQAAHLGADLLLRDLSSGHDELIGGVADFAFNRPGTHLAYTLDAAGADGNGLYLAELSTGRRMALDTERARYARLTWSDDGRALAVLRGTDADTLAQRENALVVVTGIAPRADPRTSTIPPAGAGLPADHVISEHGTLEWAEGNERLFFGIRRQEVVARPDPNAWQKASDVDVFHWADDRIQTVQRRQAEADRNRTDRAVLHLPGGRIVRLTDPTLRTVQSTRDGRWAVASDDRAYLSDWMEPRADWYRIDPATGARTRFLEAQARTLGLSPQGAHFLYWRGGQVWAYQLDRDRHVNLTASAPVSFVNQEWDYIGEKPPYGVAGWTADGRAVVLEHRYDLWMVALDGATARNLTGGVGDEREIRLRALQLDSEARFIDLSRPLLLSAYGEWTKQSGFFELRGGRLRELVLEDRHHNVPVKAERADRLLFTREHWTEFPDLHVSRLDFAEVRRLTEANPQQEEYAWGRRILFDFENREGVRLQGTLAIPDSWVPGQRLPMIVNFYEKNSQNLHRYQTPTYVHRPQFAAYVSQGYLVMQPDIHFRGGSSHSDMLECVEAAVRKVVEMGYADPARVGLHGHSYSGGGASFIATRSNMFAAIVAGAAPINLVSEFNQLFRGSGQNNHRYDIHGQGRYGTNPYDDFDLYWRESPISGVGEMNTPLLYMHGDDDQTVEYLQGMELYNALRFNRRPVIFLSYPGEGHGLTRLENQLDFQTRMEEFFGHYLRGEPAPAWITGGERYIDKQGRQPIPIATP
jgi:dipeptidyl aminopeptidase/acylaminoacyl peptidase